MYHNHFICALCLWSCIASRSVDAPHLTYLYNFDYFLFPFISSLSLFPLYISAALSLLCMIFTSFFFLHHTQVPSLLNGQLWLASSTFGYTVTAWVVSDDVMDTYLVTLVYNLSLFPLSHTQTRSYSHTWWYDYCVWKFFICLYLSFTSLEASCSPLYTLTHVYCAFHMYSLHHLSPPSSCNHVHV